MPNPRETTLAGATAALILAVMATACAKPAPQPPKADPAIPAATTTAPGAAGRSCADRALDYQSCTRAAGCALDWSARKCRDLANACERVVFAVRDDGVQDEWSTGDGRPTFGGGDPCARVDPKCAFDTGTRLCQPFTAVAACPATSELAAATTVSCGHPAQKKLDCNYPNTNTTFYCGRPYQPPMGVAPRPGFYDQPQGWIRQPDYDDRGCPTSHTSLAAGCSAPRQLQCTRGLAMFQCIRGRWKQTRQLTPPQ